MMQCDMVKQELNALADGEQGFLSKWRIKRHLGKCSVCTEDLIEIERLGEPARDYRNAHAPVELKARIASALFNVSSPQSAAVAKSRTIFKQIPAVTLGMISVIAVGIFILILDNTAIAALQRIETAAGNVKSAKVSFFVVDSNGSRSIQRQLWYQQGRWRLEYIGRGVQIYREGKMWSYNSEKRSLVSRPADRLPGRHWSGFSFKDISSDFIRWGPSGVKLRKLGTERRGNRETAKYLIENVDDAPEPTQALIEVDATSDLPIHLDKQHQINGKWTTRVSIEFEFNQPLPVSLFDPQALTDKNEAQTSRKN